jgi:hypothetical protein
LRLGAALPLERGVRHTLHQSPHRSPTSLRESCAKTTRCTSPCCLVDKREKLSLIWGYASGQR